MANFSSLPLSQADIEPTMVLESLESLSKRLAALWPRSSDGSIRLSQPELNNSDLLLEILMQGQTLLCELQKSTSRYTLFSGDSLSKKHARTISGSREEEEDDNLVLPPKKRRCRSRNRAEQQGKWKGHVKNDGESRVAHNDVLSAFHHLLSNPHSILPKVRQILKHHNKTLITLVDSAKSGQPPSLYPTTINTYTDMFQTVQHNDMARLIRLYARNEVRGSVDAMSLMLNELSLSGSIIAERQQRQKPRRNGDKGTEGAAPTLRETLTRSGEISKQQVEYHIHMGRKWHILVGNHLGLLFALPLIAADSPDEEGDEPDSNGQGNDRPKFWTRKNVKKTRMQVLRREVMRVKHGSSRNGEVNESLRRLCAFGRDLYQLLSTRYRSQESVRDRGRRWNLYLSEGESETLMAEKFDRMTEGRLCNCAADQEDR